MNEKEYLCIIRHEVPEVQKKILLTLRQNFEVDRVMKTRLKTDDAKRLWGDNEDQNRKLIPLGFRFNNYDQDLYIVILLTGNPEELKKILGHNGDPCRSPLNSIQYKYGESKEKNAIYYWDTDQHIEKVKMFFPKKYAVGVA